MDKQGPVTTVLLQVLDVGTERFGDPQPVQRQRRRQRVITTPRQASLNEECAKFVAVQTQRRRFVVLLRAADVGAGVAVDDAFLFAVPVEPADGRQSPPDRRAG
jgi:hypothetical protein